MIPSEIKLHAKEIMIKRQKPVMICSFLYAAAYILLLFLIYKLYGYYDYMAEFYNALLSGKFETMPAVPEPTPVALMLAAAVGLMLVLIGTGYASSVLKSSRGTEFNARALLDGFECFMSTVVIHLSRAVIVSLGFAFFIVPGFILMYRYRLAVFVMFDNPEKSAFWCLAESARLMKNHKIELLRLDLSFLPLFLLSEVITLLAAPLLELWLRPYFGISCAIFYNGLLPAQAEEPPGEA